MICEWWAISEQVGKERHLVGVDRRFVDIPDLFRTRKAAEASIADWKRENPAVKTWGLRAERVTISFANPAAQLDKVGEES